MTKLSTVAHTAVPVISQLIICLLSISVIGDNISTRFYGSRHLHLAPYSQMFSHTQQPDKSDTITPSCLFKLFFQNHWHLRVSQVADEWERCRQLDQWKVIFPEIESADLIFQRSLLGFKTNLELRQFKQETSIMKLFGRFCFKGMMNWT